MIVMKTGALVLAGVLALLAPLLAACADRPTRAGTSVVTSFYPLQYVARRVAGDHASVVNLTQPGKEPHDLELTVQQTAQVADADVVVYERGFQAAVDDAVDQNGPAHVVDAARSADLSGDDPHFWLDPTKLSAVAAAVERSLADDDPAQAADYARNLRRLQGDLADLDASFRTGLATCAVDTIVVSHDAFGYLGRRYGLDVVGINGLSPDAEPSPAHLRALQDLIRRDGITTVFSEELASPKFADSLSRDLGITATVLDPIEGLGDATADQDYLSLMRANLAALRKANRCS
jgi:zinc transport system substrate-binding protein